MTLYQKLAALNLNTENTIVIGSGVLEALNIRTSGDVDLVVTQPSYDDIEKLNKFAKSTNHGVDVLSDDYFEIGTRWHVLGKDYGFTELCEASVILDRVRYISVEFLLQVKERWVKEDEVVRQKDVRDVELIHAFLKTSA